MAASINYLMEKARKAALCRVDDKMSIGEMVSLIHGEWTDALREYYRNGDEKYHVCMESPPGECHHCCPKDQFDCLNYGREKDCKYYDSNPRGAAAELADGVILILFVVSNIGSKFAKNQTIQDGIRELPKIYRIDNNMPIPQYFSILHMQTSKVFDGVKKATPTQIATNFVSALLLACSLIKRMGYEPDEIILEKCAYYAKARNVPIYRL